MEQKHSKKMFVQIVNQLRELIATQQIQPGEKLPSERVLCEQLNVGRSSVREALRSLELLGLIETRHGGGTFLADVGQHKLVDILSSFILQGTKSIEDINATREMHEREAIRIICRNNSLRNLPIWDSLFVSIELQKELVREHLLRECIIASGNRLSLKIWMQLVAYSIDILKNYVKEEEKEILQVLLKSIQMGYEDEAIEAYNDWMKLLSTIA